MTQGWRHVSLALCLALLFTGQSARASKTDIIILENGTRIIGAIKQLNRGLMEVSTDGMATIAVEWNRVVFIHTDKDFIVETSDGSRAFGQVSTLEQSGELEVREADTVWRFPLGEVVVLQRIKDSFRKRWDGGIGLGATAKRANDEVALLATLDAKYRTRKQTYDISLYGSYSDRSSSPVAERYNLGFQHSAFIRSKWYSLAIADLEHNTELNLHLRTLLVGGASYEMISTGRNSLALSLGLAANHEQYFLSDLDQVSAEAYLGLTYDFFKFRTPKADIWTELRLFPSLSESPRYRTTWDVHVSWEIVKKFWFDISLYYIADSNPPRQQAGLPTDGENPSGTDWGLNTAIKWKF